MMRSHRKPGHGNMPLVALVLEMLRTAFPGFEVEEGAWERETDDGAPVGGRTGPGRPEPQERRRDQRQTSRQSRPRPDRGAPPRALDPALERCYTSLGVAPGAKMEVVRSAWRRLVREHHPDLHAGHPELQRRGSERVKEINGAYEEIKRRLARRRR
jgi:DnaJ-domain-containing protein 1